MDNEKLKIYIQEQINQGKEVNEIKQELIKVGWKKKT